MTLPNIPPINIRESTRLCLDKCHYKHFEKQNKQINGYKSVLDQIKTKFERHRGTTSIRKSSPG